MPAIRWLRNATGSILQRARDRRRKLRREHQLHLFVETLEVRIPLASNAIDPLVPGTAHKGEVPATPSDITPVYVPEQPELSGQPVIEYTGSLLSAEPMIVVGDPAGTPAVTLADRVDPNVTTSPFAGVVSLNFANGLGSFICSGALLSTRHIITAAHCADVTGGTRPGGTATGGRYC